MIIYALSLPHFILQSWFHLLLLTIYLLEYLSLFFSFFFSSRRRHTRFDCDWSSDVCSSDLGASSSQCSFGRTPSQYQSDFNSLTSQGYRLAAVSTSMSGSTLLYSAVFRTDRKSTRLNSSHSQKSYALFCL